MGKKVKVMKAMKKKAMKKSVIAKGKMAKAMVMRGSKEKTSGGLKKDSLRKNKGGKIVSKKASESSKKKYAGSAFQKWIKACQAARKAFSPWAERLPRAVPCTPRRRRSTRLEEIIGKRTLLTFGLVMRDRGFSASRVRRRHWLAA